MKEVFQILTVDKAQSAEEQKRRLRANALGSLYYHIKIVLQRKKLTDTLHKPICQSLERDFIKDVYELPRDHFKSTICSEGLPVWWCLPVSQEDLDFFKQLGYSDEFCNWLLRVHDSNVRTLLVSENSKNAAKLGSRIAWHFESNDIFRFLFPEILPTSNETWETYSLHIHRPHGIGAAHGEGTFDFLGVGGALQSRHYKKIVQDDLVGRKAIESQSVMDKTIEYHQLVPGAFESVDKDHDNDELIVGNRWSFHDLGSYIRENEPWFQITNHSALGGCCLDHPLGTPIFPEEFSKAKLNLRRKQFGAYGFSCQFLNNPAAPENADFREEWLNYFTEHEDSKGRRLAKHEVKDGVVVTDLMYGALKIAMMSDPNHSGNEAQGRCRHSIVVVGENEDTKDYYLLDCWAKACSYDSYIKQLFDMAAKWRLKSFGVENIAAQKYLIHHLKYRSELEGRNLRIVGLRGEIENADGTVSRNKKWRIRNGLSPIFEEGRFWVQRRFQEFLDEYKTFPDGKYVDILDALAFLPQMLKSTLSPAKHHEFLMLNRRQNRFVGQAYSVQ